MSLFPTVSALNHAQQRETILISSVVSESYHYLQFVLVLMMEKVVSMLACTKHMLSLSLLVPGMVANQLQTQLL